MARRFARVAVAGLSLAAAACGGADRGRPSGEMGEDTVANFCDVAQTLEFLPIAEFEPIDALGATACAINGCSFYFNLDRGLSPSNPAKVELAQPGPLPGSDREPICPPGAVTDAPFDTPGGSLQVTALSEPRCGSLESAYYFWGKDLAVCVRPETSRTGWGAAIDVNLTPNMGMFIDASEWDGVAFWARKGSDATGDAINFSIVDEFTSGEGAAADPDTGEIRRCNTSDPSMMNVNDPPVPDTEKCDGFGTAITLTDDWTLVRAPFSALRQKGFGMPSPLGELDATHLRRFQFLMSAGDWSFWIDDIAFYRAVE